MKKTEKRRLLDRTRYRISIRPTNVQRIKEYVLAVFIVWDSSQRPVVVYVFRSAAKKKDGQGEFFRGHFRMGVKCNGVGGWRKLEVVKGAAIRKERNSRDFPV